MSASAVRPRSRVVAPPKSTPAPAPSEAAITRMLARAEPQRDATAPALEQSAGDAALFAFEPRLAPLVEAAAEASREHSRLENVAFDMVGPCPAAFTPEAKAWAGRLKAAERKCGQTAAERRFLSAQDAVLAVLADLSRQPATTLPGLVFKARLAFEHASDDLSDSVLEDLIALGGSSAPSAVPCADPDPIFAAIDARVRAEAAYDAWDEAQGGRRTTASERAEENALSAASLAAYRQMLATVPTTAAGRLALLDRLQVEMDLHGMANGDPPEAESPFWEEFFGALRGALGAAPVAGEADPIHALIAKHRAAYAEWDRLSKVWGDCVSGTAEERAADRARKPSGDREVALLDALVGARPTTLAGIAALAEYLPDALRQVDPNAQEPDSEVALRNIAAALRALGTPPAAEPTLVDQIIACWRDWSLCSDGTEEEEAAANPVRLGERRLALIDAADALPATPENLPAKALALAWVEYVSLWRIEQPREAYAIDGRLALDADAAICGRLWTGA